jgi:pyrimidine deaminase RibD-like protein
MTPYVHNTGNNVCVCVLLCLFAGAGVSRVVVGLENPLPHSRGLAVRALRSAGITVGEFEGVGACTGVCVWLGMCVC